MSDRHFGITLLVILILFFEKSQEESNVGCLFENDLCEPDELCFDDNAFGRCQSRSDNKQGLKHSLDTETLQLLEREMRRLYESGYRWDNDYTQCLIRQILYTSVSKILYDPGLCSRLLSLSKPIISPEIAMKLEKFLYPEDLNLVKFSPNHNMIFAQEVFLPNKDKLEKKDQHVDKNLRLYLKNIMAQNLQDKKSEELNEKIEDANQSEKNQMYLEYLLNEMNDEENKEVIDHPKTLSNNEKSVNAEDDLELVFQELSQDSRASNDKINESMNKLKYIPTDGISPLDEAFNQPILIDSLEPENEETGFVSNVNPDLTDWNFYRQHRHDIKKPGPSYFFHESDMSENNAIDEKLNKNFGQTYYKNKNKLESALRENAKNDKNDNNGQVNDEKVIHKKDKNQEKSNQTKEESSLREILDANDRYEAVDGRHAFLTFNQNLGHLSKGKDYVKKLESLLGLFRGTLSNIRVQNNQVTFKVNPNLHKLNASIIALKAYEFKDILKKETDLDLNSSGIGYKAKRDIVKFNSNGLVKEEFQQKLTFLTILSCFAVISALASGIVLFLVRKNLNIKQRIKGLIGGLSQHDDGVEATLDYEDLCRKQMQIANSKKKDTIEKTSAKVPNISTNFKRSQDGKSTEAPPETLSPSRSSTSSWSEEPINSNLNISTGHMILSYMEEYLKNKDRLDKEWEALCAYEPDSCSTVTALLIQNLNKNRFRDILPYDHSRVILNDLSNVNRSDYINASTITDHDPRSPVYIVTQGPLLNTCASFWQMVWEQGSVIIVMLTRLMENGISLSARYWPEEGSEVYSSYEVTLVSEHIWCDDYLVRSFFLKNLRTNETRTVTQFHFLSWPENGVPANPKSILDFRRKVNKSYRGRFCPIVVHCSDGIGRSGTYCLIDMVLNRLAKDAKEIDIAATLEHIRDQRGGSVKSKLQFEFVFKAIAEEVFFILKTLQP